MKRTVAWFVLLAVALPSSLPAQVSPTSQEDAKTIRRLVSDLDPQASADRRQKAGNDLFALLTDARIAERARQYRVGFVLAEMAAPGVKPEQFAALRDVAARFVTDPKAPADVQAGRCQTVLDEMANKSLPPERRTAAREAVGWMATQGNPEVHNDRCKMLASLLGPYAGSPDPTTCVDALLIADKAQHVAMVGLLEKSLASNLPVVRYWAAKGLADLQVGLFKLAQVAGPGTLQRPIDALLACYQKETSGPVLQEICRAVGVASKEDMTDPRLNQIIYQAFKTVFADLAGRVGRGDLTGLDAVIAALNVAAQWEALYRDARAERTEILHWVGQVAFWAQQIYIDPARTLTDAQKAALEHLMIKSADVIAGALQNQDLAAMGLRAGQGKAMVNDVQRELGAGHGPEVGQILLDWVGGPGQDHYHIEKLGIVPPAALPPPPATQPGS